MKTTLTTLLITTALAMPFLAQAEEPTPEQKCMMMYELSENIMLSRQSGVDLPTAMSVSDNSLYQEMVRDAYSQQRYSTERYQQQAAQRFGEQVYTSCRQAMKDQGLM